MASSISTQSLLVMHSSRTSSYPSSASVFFLKNPARNAQVCGFAGVRRKVSRRLRAMLQETVQGPSATYAREMERLSAKESLLLAVSFSLLFFSFKDSSFFVNDGLCSIDFSSFSRKISNGHDFDAQFVIWVSYILLQFNSLVFIYFWLNFL